MYPYGFWQVSLHFSQAQVEFGACKCRVLEEYGIYTWAMDYHNKLFCYMQECEGTKFFRTLIILAPDISLL